jgi:hypothetical protein
MCYNLAYSVLTPITNGETGLRCVLEIRSALLDGDSRVIDQAEGPGFPITTCSA